MTERKAQTRFEPSDDEISLVDLALILLRRKLWVIGTFAVVVLAGAAQVVLAPHPGYEGSARVEMVNVPVGSWTSVSWIIDEGGAETSAARQRRVVEPLEALAGEESVRLSVSASGGWLRLDAEGPEREAVRAVLAAAVAEGRVLVERHWLPYARSVADAYVARLDELDRRAGRLNALAAEAEEPVAMAAFSAAEMAVLDRIDRERALADRRGPMESLMGAYHAERLVEPRVSGPSVESRSRAVVVMGLAVVLGLMGGLFAAFFAEFIANVRERRQAGAGRAG